MIPLLGGLIFLIGVFLCLTPLIFTLSTPFAIYAVVMGIIGAMVGLIIAFKD